MERPYRKDIKYTELEKILLHNGFYIASGKGDHVIFKHKKIGGHISIDSGGTFMQPYTLRDVEKALSDLDKE